MSACTKLDLAGRKRIQGMNTFDASGSVGVQAIRGISNKFSYRPRLGRWNIIISRHDHTVFLMTSPHIQVYVTLPCVIGGIEIGDFRKDRAGIFCQGVKRDIVDADEEDLGNQRWSVR